MDTESTKIIAERISASAATVPLLRLSEETGISRTTLRRKLGGKAEFKISELLVLSRYLKVSMSVWLDGMLEVAA